MSRVAQLERLLASDPEDAELLYMLAQEHAKARSWPQALRWYDACIARDPEHHYAYFHKARAQQASGDEPSALITLRAGLARAQAAGHAKAAGEIAGFIDELEG